MLAWTQSWVAVGRYFHLSVRIRLTLKQYFGESESAGTPNRTCGTFIHPKLPWYHFPIQVPFIAAQFPLTPALKKLQLAAGRCCHQITEVDQTRILLKIYFLMKNNKHHFYIDAVKKLSF
jgi:hypothetical protein